MLRDTSSADTDWDQTGFLCIQLKFSFLDYTEELAGLLEEKIFVIFPIFCCQSWPGSAVAHILTIILAD